jgi:hypothetical protein
MANEKTELIPWVPMPTWILVHPTLSPEAVRLYGVLLTWDLPNRNGCRKGYIYASLAKIAERAGVVRSSVCRGLAELEKAGAIRTELDIGRKATRHLEGQVFPTRGR